MKMHRPRQTTKRSRLVNRMAGQGFVFSTETHRWVKADAKPVKKRGFLKRFFAGGRSVRTMILEAQSEMEIKLALAKSSLYRKASNKTLRRWQEAAELRRLQLKGAA